MHLAYTWIVSHLSAKNYRNLWKFDKVLTKTNLLSFFGGHGVDAQGELHFWSTAQRGGHGPSGPMVNTPVVLRLFEMFVDNKVKLIWCVTRVLFI